MDLLSETQPSWLRKTPWVGPVRKVRPWGHPEEGESLFLQETKQQRRGQKEQLSVVGASRGDRVGRRLLGEPRR